MEKIVVTRHPALVAFLLELGLVDETVKVLAHVTAADVVGKHVFGVLPLSLAALAAKVTEIPLTLPAEKRGVELTLDDMKVFAGKPTTYVVVEEKPE
jgi:hypothetical protein